MMYATKTHVAASFITPINKPPGRVYGVRAPFWARRVYMDYIFIAIVKSKEIEPDWSRKGIFTGPWLKTIDRNDAGHANLVHLSRNSLKYLYANRKCIIIL